MKIILYGAIITSLLAVHSCIAQHSFMVGGWIPYWKAKSAIATVNRHLELFDQLSPFAYEVQKDGSIKNRFSNKYSPFILRNNQKKVLIPTISWHITEQLHTILSNKKKRSLHIQYIMNLIRSNNLSGININYELIAPYDREHFMAFIENLSRKLP